MRYLYSVKADDFWNRVGGDEDGIKLTKEQSDAVFCRGRNTLVAAAAGSEDKGADRASYVQDKQ